MQCQGGNVLFLILIAVALFAALSYAVTSSTRGGAGNIGKEKQELAISQIVQYGVSLRSAALRMSMNGISREDLKLNEVGEYLEICDPSPNCVFGPAGGGAVQQHLPDLGSARDIEDYEYITSNGNLYIVAHLSDSDEGRRLCELINSKIGITTMPVSPSASAIPPDGIMDACLDGVSVGVGTYTFTQTISKSD